MTYHAHAVPLPRGGELQARQAEVGDYDEMSSFPVTDPVLEARLRDVAARFFVALKGASFGRCDLRVDKDGTPFMLEINPNCGVFYPPADPGSADLCLMRDPGGPRRLHAPVGGGRAAAARAQADRG